MGLLLMRKNLCQSPLCHLYNTDDRIKKGNYQTRSAMDYYHNHFCTLKCQNDFLEININRIIDFVGRKTTPSIRKQGQPDLISIKRQLSPNGHWWELGNQEVLNHLNNN